MSVTTLGGGKPRFAIVTDIVDKYGMNVIVLDSVHAFELEDGTVIIISKNPRYVADLDVAHKLVMKLRDDQ